MSRNEHCLMMWLCWLFLSCLHTALAGFNIQSNIGSFEVEADEIGGTFVMPVTSNTCLQITVSGTCNGFGPVGDTGDKLLPYLQNAASVFQQGGFIETNGNMCQLSATVGSDEYLLGAQNTITVFSNGILVFRVVDYIGGYYDNDGEFDVFVQGCEATLSTRQSPSPAISGTPSSSSAPTQSPAVSGTPSSSSAPTQSPAVSGTPSSSSAPTQSPATSSVPTQSPATSGTPSSSSAPTQSPATSGTPLSSSVPTQSPAISGTPSSSSVPTQSPATSSVPTQSPATSSVPTQSPATSGTPLSSSVPTQSPATSPDPFLIWLMKDPQLQLNAPVKQCGQGEYAIGIECIACPNNPILSTILIPIAYYLAGFTLLGITTILITIPIMRKYGGTVRGGAYRSLQFLIAAWTLMQIVVQVSEPLQHALGLPTIIRSFFSMLAILNFRIPSAPAGCTQAPPFTLEIALFATILLLSFSVLVAHRITGTIWLRIRNGAITLLFMAYGPIANQVFGAMACIQNTTGELMTKSNPYVLCREEGHQAAFWLALFTAILYLGIFPIVIWLRAIFSARSLAPVQNPLLLLPHRPLCARINADERFLRDPMISNISNGEYQIAQSSIKVFDLLMLGMLGAVGELATKGSAVYTTLSCSIMAGLLGVLLVFRPYRKDTWFLYPSRILIILTATTVAVGTCLPNAFQTAGISQLITVELVTAFAVLGIAYCVSLIGGAKREEFIHKERQQMVQELQSILVGNPQFQQLRLIEQYFHARNVYDLEPFQQYFTKQMMYATKTPLRSVFNMKNPIILMEGEGQGQGQSLKQPQGLEMYRSRSFGEVRVQFAPAQTRGGGAVAWKDSSRWKA